MVADAVEKIRINPDYHFLGIEATQAEVISVLLMITGISAIINLIRKGDRPNLSTE